MKKLIIRILNSVGYDIVKTSRVPFSQKDRLVKVGNYTITMPSINPLIRTYESIPDFSSELGRIVQIVYEKYPGMIALDVGANTGDTIAILKSSVDIPIVSIEGDPFSFKYLKKNSSLFKNVTILNNYLGERDEFIGIKQEKKGWNTTLIPDDSQSDKLELLRLDTLVKQHSIELDKIKLLKVDTEGFDTIILRGSQELIRVAHPVIYIEYNRDNMSAINEDGLSTILQLSNLGYSDILFFDDAGRFILTEKLENRETVTSLHNYADGKKGKIYYYNLCLIHRDDSELATKIEKAEFAYHNLV
jgi:FkbM family methyltransferase